MSKDPMQWLSEDRKLDPDLLSAMGVKTVQHRALGPAVAFQYLRAGKPYAAKFRGVEKKDFRSTEGISRGLYNEDDLRRMESKPIVITEGEIDCLSVMQSSFERAVSLPDGWTKDGNKTEALAEAEELLRNSPYVIVAGDSDEAGESLPRVVATLLKGHDVRLARWPDGCKDANEVLVKHGDTALALCLQNAERIDPPGGKVTGFSDMPPMSARRVLRIHESPFDKVVALELGALSVWTGMPGNGKSTFLTWMAERVTVEENVRAGILAFETHPHEIRDQLSMIRTGFEYAELESKAREALLQSLDDRFRLVHAIPDDTTQNLSWLEQIVTTLALRDNCKLVIIDPWNELEHMPEPGESMTTYINFATKFIRQLAERLNIHIALVAHPKKMPAERAMKAPTGYDIADSAAFFNKPSLGVTVHQGKRSDPDTGDEEQWVELHVWKVRNTRLYKLQKGRVRCHYDRFTGRFERYRQEAAE
jgi:twinkle protein